MASDSTTDPDPPAEVSDTAPADPRFIPHGAPARERLRPRGRAAAPWAIFFPDWYAETYGETAGQLAALDFRGVLGRYLAHGQHDGHSPNPFFDEAWYRATYPDVAAAIANGRIESGFDHYCRAGLHGHAPHWLFDEQHYRRHNPDLTDATLAALGMVNGYAHYLAVGDREKRSGSRFFDPRVYRANAGADVQAAIDLEGAFLVFLRHLDADPPEHRTTHYFDPEWYRATYPEVATAIDAGDWRSALHHYLTNATPTAFDPLPVFSERDYLARYPDIAVAIEAGQWRNGYAHFLANGAEELRTPSIALDLEWYVANHATVRAEIAAGRAPDAFTHYLVVGQAAGLASAPPPDVSAAAPRDAFAALFHARAAALLPTIARAGLDFTTAGPASLAVVMHLRDRFALTVQSLAALRERHAGAIELLLVDGASSDETRHILRYVRGARLVRFDTALPATVARNVALPAITAPAVLLLGNDTEVAHGAIDAALRRLDSDATIGAVGGKLLAPDASLREAGGIVRHDGHLLAYRHGASPMAPEANFVRAVDFCSTSFLLLRTALLQDLGGFDAALQRPDHADADLCLRVAGSGHRVVYDPAVATYRLDDVAVGGDPAADDANATRAFIDKHLDRLQTRPLADAEVFARAVDRPRKRVLFIEDLVPLRRIGSGFVRSNDLIREMTSMGVFVTVYPLGHSDFDPAAIHADLPDTVEVMHDRTLAQLDAFLAERAGYYDVVWIARTHNLDRVLSSLGGDVVGSARARRVVLDTEAIAALREATRRRLSQPEEPFDLNAALHREFANAQVCQSITAVNAHEASMLRGLGLPHPVVLGHIRDPAPTSRAFAERSGMLFIGAMHDMDSPNYDGLCWFVDEVLPLVERELGWETRLSIVGFLGPDVSLQRFANHPRVTLRGVVTDTEPLYNAHRIFVAPTRYAAGTPYKIHEAASFGVPVVATELLRWQLGWEDGKDLLAADTADPAQFARHVVALYRDPALWQTLRENALARLAAENGREHYARALTTILEL